ncbi:MAG: universal stress protein [Myxococcales bacterium]|nr:universal stress protein [Myxococcales bacterium]
MYSSILVALDGSPRAPKVLEHALAVADRFGATLHLCRAVNIPLGLPPDAWTLTGEQLTAALIDAATRELLDLIAHLPAERRGLVICKLGKPARVIDDAAEACEAELVVIGSHGYDALDRVLGTTAARVVNHSKRPVLVVR